MSASDILNNGVNRRSIFGMAAGAGVALASSAHPPSVTPHIPNVRTATPILNEAVPETTAWDPVAAIKERLERLDKPKRSRQRLYHAEQEARRIVDPDIQALQAVSPMVKYRMQVERNLTSKREQEISDILSDVPYQGPERARVLADKMIGDFFRTSIWNE